MRISDDRYDRYGRERSSLHLALTCICDPY
jgi:hypothetical protein